MTALMRATITPQPDGRHKALLVAPGFSACELFASQDEAMAAVRQWTKKLHRTNAMCAVALHADPGVEGEAP